MVFKLYPHQEKAIGKLHSGAILAGKVGSGKTLTALAYYKEKYSDLDLIVITTAKKRNDGDWVEEAKLVKSKEPVVDSWNNVERYVNRRAFFIFDEQHASGRGKWAKTFIKIAKHNKWIMLSATPGDRWVDYAPIFIANGMVKDITSFNSEFVRFNPHTPFPQIMGYVHQHKLEAMRKAVIVTMEDKRNSVRHKFSLKVGYDKEAYDEVVEKRFNPFTEKPIKNPSELAHVFRRITYTSQDRIDKFVKIISEIPRVIVFYNYEYELNIIKDVLSDRRLYFYNGRTHDPSPTSTTEDWVYVVQYSASEAWNNISCDRMIFFSPNYSYKVVEQCEGRIDRINTPFKDLYYATLVSDAPIDQAVMRAINSKRIFNEKIWSEQEYGNTRE